MPKKVAVGVVTSDKMQKTRRVEIPRLIKHPVYGKYIRQRTICHVHDEEEASALGDTVEIIEAQPRSKMKRWDLVRVVKRNSEADIAALRAAREVAEVEQEVTGKPDADGPDLEAGGERKDPSPQAEASGESSPEDQKTTPEDEDQAGAKEE
jgi:small subunit ribosomal protein S17